MTRALGAGSLVMPCRQGPGLFLGLVLVLFSAALLSGCGESPRRGRVWIVGIDGASPLVMDDLLAQQRLPTLGALAESGVYAQIDSGVRPLASPVVWTSVATGKDPSQHGILDFTKDEGGRRVMYDAVDRLVPALWNIASEAGLSVAVVNWWNTFPPEVVDGVIVSDYALPGMDRERSEFLGAENDASSPVVAYPAARSAQIRAWLAEPPGEGDPANPFADPEIVEEGIFFTPLIQQYERDVALTRLAERLEDEHEADLTLVLLTGIDRSSHILWRYIEPEGVPADLRPREESIETGRALLESYYEMTDQLLGRILAHCDLERDLVIVLSDHGFEPGETRMITGRHATDRAARGVLFAAGRGIDSDAVASEARVVDVFPTVLQWLRLPLANDLAGRALTELFLAKSPLLAPHPSVPTYDDLPIERLDVEDEATQSRIVEELRALGYLQ